MVKFGGSERLKSSSRRDRASTVMERAIRQTLEAVVILNLFPRSEFCLNIEILQSDGGDLSAAINAAVLAFVNAGVPLQDLAAASSAGFINSEAVLGTKLVVDDRLLLMLICGVIQMFHILSVARVTQSCLFVCCRAPIAFVLPSYTQHFLRNTSRQ